MIITDLKHVETSEDTLVEGGLAAVLTALSSVTATGPNNAGVVGNFNVIAASGTAAGELASINFVGLAIAN